MLTPKEKRFLKYWDEQKAGGKLQYIIVYTIGWSFILFFIPLAISFFVNMYVALKLHQLPVWAAIVLSIVLGFLISLFTWHQNEKKQKALLDKHDEVIPPLR